MFGLQPDPAGGVLQKGKNKMQLRTFRNLIRAYFLFTEPRLDGGLCYNPADHIQQVRSDAKKAYDPLMFGVVTPEYLEVLRCAIEEGVEDDELKALIEVCWPVIWSSGNKWCPNTGRRPEWYDPAADLDSPRGDKPESPPRRF